MTILRSSLWAMALCPLVTGCAIESKKTEEKVQTMPINCATADGELRVLESEKKTT